MKEKKKNNQLNSEKQRKNHTNKIFVLNISIHLILLFFFHLISINGESRKSDSIFFSNSHWENRLKLMREKNTKYLLFSIS